LTTRKIDLSAKPRKIFYRLEVITPDGGHADLGADTPFPAMSVGDIIDVDYNPVGETIGVPDGLELVIREIIHDYIVLESGEYSYQVTTGVLTSYRPKNA
jgi:hypothetical protein